MIAFLLFFCFPCVIISRGPPGRIAPARTQQTKFSQTSVRPEVFDQLYRQAAMFPLSASSAKSQRGLLS